MVFIGLISTSLQPLSPTSWLPSTPQPFPRRVRAKRVVVAVPKKSLVTIIVVRSPSNFIFTQFGCLLTAPKRKNWKFQISFFWLNEGLSPLNHSEQIGKIWGTLSWRQINLSLPECLGCFVRKLSGKSGNRKKKMRHGDLGLRVWTILKRIAKFRLTGLPVHRAAEAAPLSKIFLCTLCTELCAVDRCRRDLEWTRCCLLRGCFSS